MNKTNPHPFRLWFKSRKGLDEQRVVFLQVEDDECPTDNPVILKVVDRWVRDNWPHSEGEYGYEVLDPSCGEVLAASTDRISEIERKIGSLEEERDMHEETFQSKASKEALAAAAFIRSPFLRWKGATPPVISEIFTAGHSAQLQAIWDSTSVEKADGRLKQVEVAIRRTPSGYAARLIVGFHKEGHRKSVDDVFEWESPDPKKDSLGVFASEDLAIHVIEKDISRRKRVPKGGWILEIER